MRGELALALAVLASGTPPALSLTEAPSRFATLDGHRIHYKSVGGGSGSDALVFVHGWTCDMSVWRLQVPAFASRARVLGVGGKIDVENQNGSVEVRGVPSSAGKCHPLSVKSSFGAIRVYLPEGAGFKVDARTSFGKIRSEMPLTVAGSLSEDSVSGVIGDGKCPLVVANSNGSIDLLRGR